MKKKMTFLALTLYLIGIGYHAYAQAPQYLNYQGVARYGDSILSGATISLQFSIHDQTSNGAILYQEKFAGSIQTNAYGIFTVQIGSGIVESGIFDTINWGSGPKYLQVDMDATGGSNWTTLGTPTQLLSVPYALYAQSVAPSGGGVPPGTVVAYFGATPPVGWLLCNGSGINRTTYSNLFAVIGTNSGYGDQSTTFNLPDLRGYFLRGVDAGTGNDPNAGTRTSQNPGGNTGNNVGSYQSDTLISHNHSYSLTPQNAPNNVSGNSGGSGYLMSNTAGNSSTSNTGGSETRPKNVYVNYIIKY